MAYDTQYKVTFAGVTVRLPLIVCRGLVGLARSTSGRLHPAGGLYGGGTTGTGYNRSIFQRA